MASILQKPDKGGQIYELKVSTRRGALQVEVHYRWHALYGRKVRQLYAERRSGREVVVVEAALGVAIVLAAWMLDPAICATMSLGAPTVDAVGLADLDRLLKALGLRRTCSDEPRPPRRFIMPLHPSVST